MSAINTILDEIDARLRTISTGNGDPISVNKVTRAQTKPFRDGDLPALNYFPVSDTITLQQHGTDEHTLAITIEAYSKTSDQPFTDIALMLHSGIVAALNRDALQQPSHALGYTVQSLFVDSMTPIIGEGQNPWCGVVLAISVKYSTMANEVNLI